MIAHFNIGDIFLQSEQYEMAQRELQKALELARQKKLVWMEINAGLYLVESWMALSQFDGAEQELSVLKPLIVKHASPCMKGLEFVQIACLHWKRDRLDEAKQQFKCAFDVLESEDCPYECARAYLRYAEFMKESGELESAKETLQKAEKKFNDLNNQLGLQAVDKALQLIHT
jgi:tetratricopeptide (TPR) repeat protein